MNILPGAKRRWKGKVFHYGQNKDGSVWMREGELNQIMLAIDYGGSDRTVTGTVQFVDYTEELQTRILNAMGIPPQLLAPDMWRLSRIDIKTRRTFIKNARQLYPENTVERRELERQLRAMGELK